MGGFLPWRLLHQTVTIFAQFSTNMGINGLTSYIGRLALVGKQIAKIEQIPYRKLLANLGNAAHGPD